MKAYLCVLVLGSALTFANGQNFLATLDAANEVPTGGGRTGSGLVTLTLTGTTLTLSGTFSGLSSASTLDHIHGNALPGVNAGILYSLIPISTLGGTSGTINGSVSISAAQIADLNAGLWYINIHTANFGGGEIRGQILPVPEPSTWAIGSLGLLGVLAWKRRR